ncbi:MAG TPA: NifU family protein [Nitrospirae bacterium]|nr:NifU family protein [Nitrospirota bacterium]
MDAERVEKAIVKIREGLHKEGGDIEVVDIVGTVVYVRLKGECSSCMMAGLTMKNWVEKTLREEVPEVTEVKAL